MTWLSREIKRIIIEELESVIERYFSKGKIILSYNGYISKYVNNKILIYPKEKSLRYAFLEIIYKRLATGKIKIEDYQIKDF